MAVNHEKEYGIGDTEVDTELAHEHRNGEGQPFTEVARPRPRSNARVSASSAR